MNPKYCWICRVCDCSFSGHCDDKELLSHVIDEHPNEDVFLGVRNFFKKDVVGYMKLRSTHEP